TYGLALLVLMAVPLLFAQGPVSEDNDDDGPDQKWANLALIADAHGDTKFLFSGSESLSSGHIRDFFVTKWNCRIEPLGSAGRETYRRMSAQQRARIAVLQKSAEERNLSGTCAGQFSRQGLMFRGQLDLQPLSLLLEQEGTQIFQASLTIPKAPTAQITGTGN